jgi:hypothetical protein
MVIALSCFQVIRETMLVTCKLQGVVRRGHQNPKFGGGNTGVDVAANMRRDGWIWQIQQCDFVRNTGLRRAEIIMLNAFRRLLSEISSLNNDLTKWSGSDGMPQLHTTPRIHVFHNRSSTGPPIGLPDLNERKPQSDLYASPSMNGTRLGGSMHRPGMHHKSNTSDLGRSPKAATYGAVPDMCTLPTPPPYPGMPQSPRHDDGSYATSGHTRLGNHHSDGALPSPRSPRRDWDGQGSAIPFGVNFAQLNKEIRHLYSFAVIETARRVGDVVVNDAGGMQKIIDSASETVPAHFRSQYAVGPAHGDARVLCAQRLHDNLQQLLQGMRRVLEDKAFIALTRGVWDHIGSRAYNCLQNLATGGENPVRLLKLRLS